MKKKILIGAAAVVVLLLGGLAVAGSTPLEVRTEIDIAAPPQAVWDVVAKVDGWPEWNTTVSKATGTAALNADLDVTMFAADGVSDGPRYQPKVIKLDAPTHLEWRAHMLAGFVFTNDKVLKLQSTPTGTKLVHIERFSGMMLPLMTGMMNEGVPPILNTMNKDLKGRVEGE